MQRKRVATFSAIMGAALLIVAPAFAAQPAVGDRVEGVITDVDLVGSPRHITVRTGSDEVQIRIANRTNVDFGSDTSLSPELSSLKPGMTIRATYNGDEPAPRIEVVSVPGDLRSDALSGSERERAARTADTWGRDAQEMKVRLLKVNRSRGEFSADYAGKTRTFVAEDPKMLARFDEGDLVIVKTRDAAGRDAVVTDIHSAMLFGRVLDVDTVGGKARVLVDGKEEAYKINRLQALKLKEGDRISFEVEERPTGEREIVKVDDHVGKQ
jgi:hypothetical protein